MHNVPPATFHAHSLRRAGAQHRARGRAGARRLRRYERSGRRRAGGPHERRARERLSRRRSLPLPLRLDHRGARRRRAALSRGARARSRRRRVRGRPVQLRRAAVHCPRTLPRSVGLLRHGPGTVRGGQLACRQLRRRRVSGRCRTRSRRGVRPGRPLRARLGQPRIRPRAIRLRVGRAGRPTGGRDRRGRQLRVRVRHGQRPRRAFHAPGHRTAGVGQARSRPGPAREPQGPGGTRPGAIRGRRRRQPHRGVRRRRPLHPAGGHVRHRARPVRQTRSTSPSDRAVTSTSRTTTTIAWSSSRRGCVT